MVWCTDLYQEEAIRQLSYPNFYTKVNKDLTSANQKIVKDTIQELTTGQELPVTAQNLIMTTPRTSYIYFKPKIHKAKNPGRPIVSACSCLTELTSLTNKFHFAVRLFSEGLQELRYFFNQRAIKKKKRARKPYSVYLNWRQLLQTNQRFCNGNQNGT